MIGIIWIVQVSFASAIVGSIESLPVTGTAVRSAAMCQVRAEHEQLVCLELDTRPSLHLHPFGYNTIVVANGNFRVVAAIYDFKPDILHIGVIHSHEDGKMLDAFDVSVGRGVDVERLASAASQFVVDLFLEQDHLLPGQLGQDVEDFGTW